MLHLEDPVKVPWHNIVCVCSQSILTNEIQTVRVFFTYLDKFPGGNTCWYYSHWKYWLYQLTHVLSITGYDVNLSIDAPSRYAVTAGEESRARENWLGTLVCPLNVTRVLQIKYSSIIIILLCRITLHSRNFHFIFTIVVKVASFSTVIIITRQNFTDKIFCQ